MVQTTDQDRAYMATALRLAARGLGSTGPNPSVGCVIVRDNMVLGTGVTQAGGRPHAETEALRSAGEKARGASAYVTLEPCAHHGTTAPCADALIDAGISRVVIAIEDPDPRVQGRGREKLRQAGIDVIDGVGREAARRLNLGFFLWHEAARPLIALKMAVSADGRIAMPDGKSQWITGEQARRHAHMLRARHDAIMVGCNTAVKDNPELTCRIPGLSHRSPVRIIIGRQALPPELILSQATPSDPPVWFVSDVKIGTDGAGATIIPIEADKEADGFFDLAAIATKLGERGIRRVLVEGGGFLAAKLLAADLVDIIYLYRAGLIIGNDGLPAVGVLAPCEIATANRFRADPPPVMLGEDVLETWVRDR